VDGASAVVVLLFVMVIFSSLPQGSSQNTTAAIDPGAPRSALFDSQFSTAELPQQKYTDLQAQDQAAEERIATFIRSYARAAHKGLASSIASSIVKYCQVYDVNPYLVTALIARESRFNPQAVSSRGAVGLGQLMPSTASKLGVADSYDIDQNVEGTVKYLNKLLQAWQGEEQQVSLALASYLAGPAAISRTAGLSEQTKSYVMDILKLCYKI
jgi:soluble lytic murein transglycosylase-like protein